MKNYGEIEEVMCGNVLETVKAIKNQYNEENVLIINHDKNCYIWGQYNSNNDNYYNSNNNNKVSNINNNNNYNNNNKTN